MARYIFVEAAYVIGDDADRSGLILVEDDDLTIRRATGSDLVRIHEEWPRFVRSVEAEQRRID